MIEVVIADHQEIFRIGIAEVLAATGEVRIAGQAQSSAQLLNTLKQAKPHVLILSTSLLPALPKIKQTLERRQTALLLLAEESDNAAYSQWLRVQGIVYRSMDELALVDAVRRLARSELFLQESASDKITRVRGYQGPENKLRALTVVAPLAGVRRRARSSRR